MIEKEIITEIERYLSDKSYNYAVMIDGDWGCGKTYFVKKSLIDAINKYAVGTENHRVPKYISLYGCKTVSEIQDAIVFALGEEITKWKEHSEHKEGKTGVGKKLLVSTLKIAKAVRDIQAPGTSFYDLVENWLNLESFIFIFDDIERCDCPLNEAFGYINGLVEHEGVKVILVANEKEIRIDKIAEQKELQYLVAVNDIVFPKLESVWHDQHDPVPLTPEELERRRRIMFPATIVDEDFKKIREKLIGVTLHFQPDVKVIFQGIINESAFDDVIKSKLRGSIELFYTTMRDAEHLNLRTFQFFLSKLNRVLDVFNRLNIPQEYVAVVEEKVISDCFSSAVDFKANMQPPEEEIASISFRLIREKRLKTIENYIETGEFRSDRFYEEINRFIDENLINLIPTNDPYKQVLQEHLLHPQAWFEEKIKEILTKLENNQYPIIAYGEVLQPFLILESLGFDKGYLDTAKAYMLTNIAKVDHPLAPDRHLLLFEENPDSLLRAQQVFTEIENAVAEQNNTAKKLGIEEILKQDSWVDGLSEFAEQNNLKEKHVMDIFSSVDYSVWLSLLYQAAPKTLYSFKKWFNRFYPTNIVWAQRPGDVDVLKTIAKEIDPEKANDLIVKHLLKLVKNDIERFCKIYSRQELTTAVEDESNG